MLHISTPLWRYNLLPQVYASIPKHADITWHISHISAKPAPDFDFIHNDSRIKLYAVSCKDSETDIKRNVTFENIRDGYFCLLDDDTIFLENMYSLYKKYSENHFEGMVIGRQTFKDGRIRLNSQVPTNFGIDTGNVLSHHSILRQVKWEFVTHVCRDFLFWDSCYAIFGGEKTFFSNEIISTYNALKDN